MTHRTSTQDKYANESISRVLEAFKQLEAKDIMATIANILTLIQQNHPKARMNLRTLLDIAVEIKKVTKHNIEEEGTPSFYVTQRVAQINSFIDTSALDESKDYQTAVVTFFIHNTRYLDQLKILVHNLSDLKGLLIKIIYGESLLEETEEIYQRCLALFALMHQGGEDAAAFVFESRLRANLLGSFNTRLIAKETCMTLKPSRVLEAIKQLEAKDIMATIANILTLIQQNHPKARINLRTLLDIAVEIKKVTKHNIEEEGTPPFYVTRREAQIDSFIDTSALDESKAYQTTAATCFIHNTRESLLEETEEIYQRCLALFALMHQGGEDAVNVIVESLGVESSMIHIEAAFVFESRLRANLFC
ncbi:unnamed protein product [Arabidopsis thaliana]|uniref:DUF7625 domain-containing protein n=1 Tax=Arabidopsis thaliana TaxID=3702 RepID=A0A654FCD2_ARATH|nr:unnamed protein product [Arabidopsis thaliana]